MAFDKHNSALDWLQDRRISKTADRLFQDDFQQITYSRSYLGSTCIKDSYIQTSAWFGAVPSQI